MASPSYTPQLLGSFGGNWQCEFWDDFSNPETLKENWCHPAFKGWRENKENKWKWDGGSGKEIWWDNTCSFVQKNDDPNLNFLRVGCYTDWFHRQDRIATKTAFGHGYYEAMVRFKGAEGMHSAFWLLPHGIKDEPTQPDANGLIPGGIEIDVVEHRGCDKEGGCIAHSGNTALHWGGYGGNHKSCGWKVMDLPGRNPEQWCVFGLLHTPAGVRWFWNGREVNHAKVHSNEPHRIYFSTEITPGPCWSGKCCLKSYGKKTEPAGYIDVNWTGYWRCTEPGPAPAPEQQDEQSVKEAVHKIKGFVKGLLG